MGENIHISINGHNTIKNQCVAETGYVKSVVFSKELYLPTLFMMALLNMILPTFYRTPIFITVFTRVMHIYSLFLYNPFSKNCPYMAKNLKKCFLPSDFFFKINAYLFSMHDTCPICLILLQYMRIC
jgi:hypothetical protein